MDRVWCAAAHERAGRAPAAAGGSLRAFWALLAAFLMLVLAIPSGALGDVHVTPQDRAATLALLEARYAYEQTLVAIAPASRTAEEDLASTLGGTCPGVLAGAPHETPQTPSEFPRPPRSPRQIGEANRENRQWGDLQEELSLALNLPLIEAERQAALAYARSAEALHWSSNAVTALERLDATELEWALHTPLPQVCADMKAWVSSGFRTLSPATKTLIGEQEALVTRVFRTLTELHASFPNRDPLANPLLAYEDPREQALARKTYALESDLRSARKGLATVETGLERTLGLITQAEIQPKNEEAQEGPAKGAIEIGHGTTAAAGSYTIWLEPKPGSSPQAPRCPLSMEVFETDASSNGEVREIDGTAVNEVCLSRSHLIAPSVHCRGEMLTIEAQTLPRARTMRLRLSDGRQIASRVAVVPAKLGGPAGFYYQAVPGPSPPVALTEVDAHGAVLRTVRLPHTARCPEQLPKRLRAVHRTIAHGALPQGPSFSIVGESHSRMGKIHFDLSVEIASEEAGEAGRLIGGDTSTIVVGGRPRPKPSPPLAMQLKTSCAPHEYAILYGVLKAPTDTVLVQSSGGLQPLRQVRIPASLHAHGALAYIALPAVPSELLVRTPTGKTVFTENLTGRARDTRETCEGEAEGPG
jgi:hypothetical protein